MKKLVSFLILLVVLGFIVTSCGSEDEPTDFNSKYMGTTWRSNTPIKTKRYNNDIYTQIFIGLEEPYFINPPAKDRIAILQYNYPDGSYRNYFTQIEYTQDGGYFACKKLDSDISLYTDNGVLEWCQLVHVGINNGVMLATFKTEEGRSFTIKCSQGAPMVEFRLSWLY